MASVNDERPILFSAPMVRAILDGRKTQTRRVIKLNIAGRVQKKKQQWCIDDPNSILACQFGSIGGKLWVKETHALMDDRNCACYDPCGNCCIGKYAYRADGNWEDLIDKWTPSIYMPRKASRITLEITNIRAERLQDISEADALADGCFKFPFEDSYAYTFFEYDKTGHATHTGAYRKLWESINGKGSWDLNPWVWVIQFKRI